METHNLDKITRFFRACNPTESIKPDDPRWVDFDDVRGDDNVSRVYERSLRRADPDIPVFKLFAGHRGVGKTSELYRLKNNLSQEEKGKKPFFVVYLDVSGADGLDVNDLDFPDLLVFIAGKLQQELKPLGEEFSSINQYLGKVWEDIKSFLGSDLSIEKSSVDVPFGKLSVELRNRPSSRQKLRSAIEQSNSNLLKGVNDLLDTAQTAARNNGKEGVILLVDGLDKVAFRSLEHGNNTHDRLFIDRSEQMSSLNVHTVYTVPISLVYSPRFSQMEQTFGECHTPVSMIKLRDNFNGSINNNSRGVAALKEMIEKRCVSANISFDEVFDLDSTAEFLIEKSGGHPRHLLMFLQSACNEIDELPITRNSAEKAIRKYSNSLLREISDESWGAFKDFRLPIRNIAKDELHQEMLLLLYVFEYMNGQPWYEINPVIKDLDRFSFED